MPGERGCDLLIYRRGEEEQQKNLVLFCVVLNDDYRGIMLELSRWN